VGTQPWQDFEGQSEAGLSRILEIVTGTPVWATILAVGAVISIFSVTLVTLYGQTRILFAMGRDGMLPKVFARVSPRTQTPVQNTIIVSIVVAVLAAVVPLDYLIDLVSIGTLTAFIVVSLGVIILRRREPDLPRGFRVPGYPVTPVLSILACLYILSSLAWFTWVVFVGWVAVFLVFYLLYGRKHSVLGRERGEEPGAGEDR
jgi:amino acid transporter